MQQSLHRRDWKTYERQDKGGWPRHQTRPYPDLRRFRARPQHRILLWDEVKFIDRLPCGFCPVHQQLDKQTFPAMSTCTGNDYFVLGRRFSLPRRMRWNIILNHTTCWRDLGEKIAFGCSRTGSFLEIPLILGCGDQLCKIFAASTRRLRPQKFDLT